MAFSVTSQCSFLKLQLYALKNCAIIFAASFLFVSPQKEENHLQCNLRHTFVEKLLTFNVAKYQRKILLLAELGALQSYSY